MDNLKFFLFFIITYFFIDNITGQFFQITFFKFLSQNNSQKKMTKTLKGYPMKFL